MADTLPWWKDLDPERALAKYQKMCASEYYRRGAASVKKLIPTPAGKGARALDYGCGGGAVTVYLAQIGYEVVACDSSSCSLEACRRHVLREGVWAAVTLVQNEAPDYWKYISGPFDVIVTKDVIEHIRDDAAFLRAIAARVSDDGCLILTTQNDYSWNYLLEAPRMLATNPSWCGWHPDEHVRFYNRPRLVGLLKSVGLKPIAWRGVYLIPYQAFEGWLSRRFRNAMNKLLGDSFFFWPDFVLGRLWPFSAMGWSIQVKAVRAGSYTRRTHRRVSAGRRDLIDIVPLGLTRRIGQDPFAAFVYHVVSDKHLPHIRHLYRYKSVKMFEDDVVFLKNRYRLAKYEDLVQMDENPASWPPGHVLLTFDDGYAECFEEVRHVLLRHHTPAVFFVTTDWIDNKNMFYRNKVSLCIERLLGLNVPQWSAVRERLVDVAKVSEPSRYHLVSWMLGLGESAQTTVDAVCEVLGLDCSEYLRTHCPYLTKEQVRILFSDGFTVGAHSRTHRPMHALSEDEIEREMIEPCKTIQSWTGQAHVPFAFPFLDADVSPELLRRVLSENPYIKILFGEPRPNAGFPHVVRRISLDLPSGSSPRSLEQTLRRMHLRHMDRDSLLGKLFRKSAGRTNGCKKDHS